MESFSETQKFRQWWIWLILLGIVIFSLFSIYNSARQPGDEDTFLYVQIAVAIIGPLLVMLLFYSIKLSIRVDRSGIYYRFFPMHLTEQTILWDDITSVEIRQYNPIREYGGWGWRYSRKNGRALNIKGDKGLQIVLKNGTKLLLGTQRSEELRAVLQQLNK